MYKKKSFMPGKVRWNYVVKNIFYLLYDTEEKETVSTWPDVAVG